jgi:selenocysteine-specific translation elongation factor
VDNSVDEPSAPNRIDARSIVDVDGHPLTLPLIVIGLWVVSGAVVTIAGAGVKATTIEADEAHVPA